MFKTCKPYNLNNPIKPNTPHFPSSPTISASLPADRETIQPNPLCKSTVKFLWQPQDRRNHKSQTEKLRKVLTDKSGLKRAIPVGIF